MFLVVCLALYVAAAVYTVVYSFFGAPQAATLIALITFPIVTLAFVTFRLTGSLALGGHLLTLAMFAALAALTLTTGGLNAISTPWWVTVGLMAVLLCRVSGGIFWTLMTIGLLTVVVHREMENHAF